MSHTLDYALKYLSTTRKCLISNQF